ncbi:MAG: hypothetical protein HC900_05410 [Methylacidiphilales bacterium]|nr:hypothetical protein [Candidatus Methylacidiphilales bacterium]
MDDGVLHSPGAAAVIRASMPTTLVIEIVPAVANGSEAASLKLEPISIGRAAPAERAPEAARSARRKTPAPAAPEVDVPQIRILGHVAGIGDVVVDADRWIAGPAAPSRIEGIMIDWPDRPADVDCRYAVKFAKPRGASSAMIEAGEYAGSRRRALALVGVVFELSGPGAARYKFQTEALFLGSPVMKAAGQRVALSGPTGGEPLVGLRLAVQPVAAANVSKPATPAGVRRPAASAADRVAEPPPPDRPPGGPGPCVPQPPQVRDIAVLTVRPRR